MHYTRIYADAAGESHFEDVDIRMVAVDLVPPAPPLNMAGYEPARQVSFLSAPPGWYGEPHRAPRPSIYFLLEGEWEFETSDGEKRHFSPGAILRTDDVTGKGHISRIVSDIPALAGVVQLAE
jgi:hypothetical protein